MQDDIYNAEQEDTIIKKCPSCGGNMVFDPETKMLKCEFCGNKISVDLTKYARELALEKLFDKLENTWGDETHVFRCNNCGAREILSKVEISKKCSFCGTTNVVETDEISGLKPNAAVPFAITKEKACENVALWAKKKFFAPKKFKENVYPEEVFGNYYPAFTFDADTDSKYDGELGEYYYVTVRINGKTQRQRRIKWFRVSGTYQAKYDDVLIQAIKEDVNNTVELLQPYDTNHSQEYSSDFLQGFSASQYTKTGEECYNEAQEAMKDSIRNLILKKHHHDVVKYLNVTTNFFNVTFKYVLLPVYIGHFNYSKKLYNCYINGQTGKVTGKTPISVVKVSVLIVILIMIVLIGYFVFVKGGN